MIYWDKYKGHKPEILGKRKKFDNTIYTFDIETSSYLILDGKQYNASFYLSLDKKQQEKCLKQSTMYIWQFGINDKIYYGRTYQELKKFLVKINKYTNNIKKYIFIHNESFEFEFLQNIFEFKNVFARKSHKPIKSELVNLNFELRCTLTMTNLALKKLPKVYGLNVDKKVGDLDYSKIRHSETELSEKELRIL